MPKTVELAYADIATIFHWQPSEMDKMSINELMNFKQLADNCR